jgi:hypothetical protein
MVKLKKGKHVRHLIWLTITWCIWKLVNNVIFNGILLNASKLADDIKVVPDFYLMVVQIVTSLFFFIGVLIFLHVFKHIQ